MPGLLCGSKALCLAVIICYRASLSLPLPLNQDEELLSRIQNTILQVQGDCENLNATTGNLIEDHRQKQKDIAVSDGRGLARGLYSPRVWVAW